MTFAFIFTTICYVFMTKQEICYVVNFINTNNNNVKSI